MDKEQSVRDAAVALQKAIAEAVAAGYRVVWPGSASDLDKIAISETGAVKQPEPVARPQVSTFSRPLASDA